MAAHPIRFGIQTGQQNVEWEQLVSMWRSAEAWGYDSLWAFDHFYPIFSDPTGACLEGWTTLCALAQVTSRARIGHLVNGNTYRNPCVLAKMAASLDRICGGRLNLGLGAGWFELEHTSFGIDYPPIRARLEALDESLTIIRGMLGGEAVTFQGHHYRTEQALCRPTPSQERLPIMIGGEGKRVLLRIVARHADMWNAFGSPKKMRDLIETLARHCENEGRDPDAIEKTVMLPLVYTQDQERQDTMAGMLAATFGLGPDEARAQMMIGTRDACLEKIAAYQQVGVTHFIFMLMAPYRNEEIQAFAEEVAPAARRAFV